MSFARALLRKAFARGVAWFSCRLAKKKIKDKEALEFLAIMNHVRPEK